MYYFHIYLLVLSNKLNMAEQIKICAEFNNHLYKISCTSLHDSNNYIIVHVYKNKEKAQLFWFDQDGFRKGPNTMIDDESEIENHEILRHEIVQLIKYIQNNYEWITGLLIEDSGCYEFCMFEQETSLNWRYYYYYNLALFGETWFEKYFDIKYCNEYLKIKSKLFLSKPIDEWESFKSLCMLQNDYLKSYYESSQTMREFFQKLRTNHTPVEVCRLIGQWIIWYMDKIYGNSLNIISHTGTINIKSNNK